LYVTIAPEMGCSIDGIASDSSPDGEMIAVQAMFSMMWTGAHGRLTPWKPTELAVAVLPLLGTTEMVEMYIKKLVVQALDSPVTATLVEAHIAALVAGAAATRHLICRTMACAIVSELKRASLRMSTADCRGHELVVTNKFPHELDTAGDEHVAAAYRLLVAIGLAQSAQRSLLSGEAVLNTALDDAGNVMTDAIGILQCAPRLYWLPEPLLITLYSMLDKQSPRPTMKTHFSSRAQVH
jgi:hypothetical protein